MSTHRPLTCPSVLLVVLALLLSLGSSPASAKSNLGEVPLSAASELYGPGLWHEAAEGRTWYGAYRTFDDRYAYCIDAGRQSPQPANFDGAQPRTVTSAQTAWALHTYGTSDSADVQAALSTMARLDERIDHDHAVPPQEPGELGADFAGAAQQYAAITKEAKRLAGPYTLDVSLERSLDMPVLEPYGSTEEDAAPSTADVPPTSGAVTLTVSLTSASGAFVPDVPIELTIKGAEGPTRVTSGTAEITEMLRATEPGTVSVTATATVAPETVRLYEPTSGTRVQRVITADEPVTVTDEVSLDVDSQPRVTTEISEERPQPGDTVTDAFTVSGLIGDHRVDVVHELWTTSSKPAIGTRNDDAEVIGTVTSKDIGNGTHTSAGIRIPEDVRGWVYFTETIAADEKTSEWKGIHGQPKETGFVPWTPTADTRAEIEGSQVTDEVAVTGLRPGAEAKLTVTAYRTDSEPQQSTEASGTELASQDITVVADQEGTATVSTELIDMPVGWVTFVTTIHADDVHEGWTSDWGIPSETVSRPPAEKPSTPPAPPTSTPPSPEQPSTPPAPEQPSPPPAPEQPSTSPPVEPVAEEPEAPRAPDELPRTGVQGHTMLIGVGIVLIGLGAAILFVTGRRTRDE